MTRRGQQVGLFLLVLFMGLSAALGVSAQEKVVVRWLDWGDETQMRANEEIKAKFEARYPHIEVRLEWTSPGWQEKLTAQMVAGIAPDVVTGWGEHFPHWADLGQFLDLSPYIQRRFTQDVLDDIYPTLISGFRRAGIQFALPKYVTPMALFYNKDMFAAAGLTEPRFETWTWERMLQSAQKLTRADASGRVVQWGINDHWTMLDRLVSWIWQNGGEVMQSPETPRMLIDQPQAIEAVQFVHDLIWKHNVAPQPAQIGGLDPEVSFLQGQVAMVRDGSWSLPWYGGSADFQFDVAHFEKGRQRATMHTMDGYAIYKGSKHPDEAFLLIEFLMTPEAQIPIMREVAMPSVRRSLTADFTGFFPDKNARVFLEAMDYARPGPIFPNMGEVLEAWTPALERILVLNRDPVAEGLRKLAADVNRIVGMR